MDKSRRTKLFNFITLIPIKILKNNRNYKKSHIIAIKFIDA